MKRLGLVTVFAVLLAVLVAGSALAADDSKVKSATNQVESGAKKIPDGKIGAGVEETAKGVGNTAVEGAKYSGEKLKEAGKAAEPPAKGAWGNARDGAVGVGHTVKTFFTNLFGGTP
jgi:hypothetical protein